MSLNGIGAHTVRVGTKKNRYIQETTSSDKPVREVLQEVTVHAWSPVEDRQEWSVMAREMLGVISCLQRGDVLTP